MTYLLDADTCIDYFRKGTASNVLARMETAPDESVALCSIVVAELLLGAERSTDPAAGKLRVQEFTTEFPSLPFDDAAAEHYARVRARLQSAGSSIGGNDLLIAAIALAHGLTLVTHNTREFSRVPGLQIEDWT